MLSSTASIDLRARRWARAVLRVQAVVADFEKLAGAANEDNKFPAVLGRVTRIDEADYPKVDTEP